MTHHGKLHGLILAAMLAVCSMPVLGQPLKSGDPGFGWQWVRDNPFGIQAISLHRETWNINTYFDANMTILNKDANSFHVLSSPNRPAQYANAPWHAFLPVNETNPTVGQNAFATLQTVPGNTGWIIGDEPSRLDMPATAALTQYVRQRDPSKITYTTLGHDEWGSFYLHGNGSRPDYSYEEYIDDYISLANPDVLVYDKYSFYSNGTTNNWYLRNLMTVRAKAIEAGIPYWAWMQSFGPIGTSRQPSESDNRFNVYSHLTAGYTGLLYWTYDYYAGTGNALIDVNGNKTPLYNIVKDTNAEAINLGQSLRFLESTDVRFIPGRRTVFGSVTTPNSTPDGLTNWARGAGGDSYISSISIAWNAPGGLGAAKNGMIGFFTDDDGQQYFMLTNLNHGAGLSAAAGELSFTLLFDNSIESIWLLNRLTGLPEEILLSNHTLHWTLPGGTGDLFKYHNPWFAGLVPEPAIATTLLPMLLLARRRNRRA